MKLKNKEKQDQVLTHLFKRKMNLQLDKNTMTGTYSLLITFSAQSLKST